MIVSSLTCSPKIQSPGCPGCTGWASALTIGDYCSKARSSTEPVMKLKLPASVADIRTCGGVWRSDQKAGAGNYLAGRPPYSSGPSRQPTGPVSYSPTVAARGAWPRWSAGPSAPGEE